MVNYVDGRVTPNEERRLREEFELKQAEARKARQNLQDERLTEEKRLLAELERTKAETRKAKQDLADERKRRNSVETRMKIEAQRQKAGDTIENALLDAERQRRRAAEKRIRDQKKRGKDERGRGGGDDNDDADDGNGDHNDDVFMHTPFRKMCGPLSILFIACVIALSQLQLAFETRYDYYYEVKDTTKGGDGETYSYNLWKGVEQVICQPSCCS